MKSSFNTSNNQAISEQVFADYVKKRPTEALKRIFQSNETIGNLQNATESSILYYLAEYRNNCVELIESGSWESGTVAWKNLDDLTIEGEGGDVDSTVEEKNLYFY